LIEVSADGSNIKTSFPCLSSALTTIDPLPPIAVFSPPTPLRDTDYIASGKSSMNRKSSGSVLTTTAEQVSMPTRSRS
jgi:hypothetical protein